MVPQVFAVPAATYTVSPSSNRIATITGALASSYAYDNAGNTTGYSTVTATYNNAGRPQTLTNGGSTETSLHSALGQRIEIAGGVNGTVRYAYDEACRLHGCNLLCPLRSVKYAPPDHPPERQYPDVD